MTNVFTGTGGDTLTGTDAGSIDDTFNVSGATDSIVESGILTANIVNSSGSFTLGANLANLTLSGTTSLVGTGNTLTNIITGNTGSDTLSDGGLGGAGDTLTGNSATNGTDTFLVNNTTDVVSEHNAGTSTALIDSSVSWNLGTHTTNVKHLTLTAGSLTATGNTLSDVLSDAISGAGHDTLIGNSATNGTDIFNVNSATDVVSETHLGTSTALINSSVSWSLATNTTNVNHLTLTGTGAGLTATGNTSADTIIDATTGAGGNILTAGTGVATMTDGSTAGNDTFVINNASDHVTESHAGGTGVIDSSVNWSLGTNFVKLDLTNGGSASLTGTGTAAGGDTLIGDAGKDTLSDGSVAPTAGDAMIGNNTAGADSFIVHNSSDTVTETHGGAGVAALVTFTGSAGNTSFSIDGTGVNNLTLSGAIATTGTGNTLGGILTGSTTGIDALIGNSATGNDTFIVNHASDTVTENGAGAGGNLVKSSISFTLGANLEDLILTAGGTTATNAIVGTGNTIGDVLTSNATGIDALIGNSTGGNDTFNVNAAGDTVTENGAGAGANLVNSAISFTLGANLEALTLTGASALTATGNTLSNVLTSNTGADILKGNSTGGTDTFVVHNVGDAVSEANVGTTALVESSDSWALGCAAGKIVHDLTLTGSTGLAGTGNLLANIITGNTGTDTLSDGSGTGANDTLIGLSTSGTDIFVVHNTGDSITETNPGTTALIQSSVSLTLGTGNTNVNNLTLTGAGNHLTATGNIHGDILADATTGTGSNALIGNSTGGNDTFVVKNTGDTVTENGAGAGANLVNSAISFTLGANLEDLTLTAGGTAVSNAIVGTGNTLGDVLISSITGIDRLIGNSTGGNDTFNVNVAGDTVTENGAGAGANLVNSAISFTLGTNLEKLTLTGSGGITGTGNTLTNILTSNTGVDTLTGNSSTGNDTFFVHNAGDHVLESHIGGAGAVVNSTASFTLGANIQTLDLSTATGNVAGTGNAAGGDTITGNTGSDTLSDGSVAPTVADTLTGQSTGGTDTFNNNNEIDTVTETAPGTTALIESSVTPWYSARTTRT